MPRVHYVKSARKENPVAQVGEPYYWWKFRYGGKHFSKTRPRASQLTQSSFLSTIYGINEQIEDATFELPSDVESFRDDIISQVEELRDETQGSLDNMPEQLQEGDTGQMLQERIDALEQMISELESISIESDADEGDEDADETNKTNTTAAVEELQAISYEGP